MTEQMLGKLKQAAEAALGAAAEHERYTTARDTLIVQALRQGIQIISVSKATGLTRARIYQIRDREEGREQRAAEQS